MKLESFKFQDGKVFWLPGYPEKPIINACLGTEDLWDEYYKDIAKSLASALELTQEDKDRVIKLILARHTFGGNVNMWYPKKDKVYSAECEMEIKTVYEPLVSEFDLQFGKVPIGTQLSVARQIARLKLKDEIFPAANSHDMKELEDKRKRELADLIEFTDRLAPPDNQDELWREFYKTVLDSPNPEDHIGCSLRETLESKFHITLKS